VEHGGEPPGRERCKASAIGKVLIRGRLGVAWRVESVVVRTQVCSADRETKFMRTKKKVNAEVAETFFEAQGKQRTRRREKRKLDRLKQSEERFHCAKNAQCGRGLSAQADAFEERTRKKKRRPATFEMTEGSLRVWCGLRCEEERVRRSELRRYAGSRLLPQRQARLGEDS
jgi:hypothetical protein